MMNSRQILHKLLRKTQNPVQLIGGVLGTFTGVLLILISVQIFFDYRELTDTPTNEFGKEFIIINKKVTGLNTISGNVSSFRENDLNKIRQISSVEHIGFFSVNKFSILADISMAGKKAGIRTELFFEAVDDRFLDVLPEKWSWKPGQEFVPMILPADFINLYNFTFAPARGLPLISPNTIKLAKFSLMLSGEKGKRAYTGQVVGYSHRLNSILVPENFIEYTNAELTAKEDDEKKSRILVEIDQSKSSELLKLIKENGWETNESKLMSGKFALFLEIGLLMVILFGVLTLVVAFFSTVLYVLLSMNKAKYEIETLLILGVPPRNIINWYGVRMALVYLFVGLISIVLTWFLKLSLANYITSFGFILTSGLHPVTIIMAIVTLSGLWFFQYARIRLLK